MDAARAALGESVGDHGADATAQDAAARSCRCGGYTTFTYKFAFFNNKLSLAYYSNFSAYKLLRFLSFQLFNNDTA